MAIVKPKGKKKPAEKQKDPLRQNNGALTAAARREMIQYVATRFRELKTRSEIILELKEKYPIINRTAEEIFAEGEKEFLLTLGVSKPQIKDAIYRRALQTLGRDDATTQEVDKSARLLMGMFDLKEGNESVDKRREVRLWKDYIDSCGIEELNLLQEQFDSETFALEGISEEVVAARREKRGN